MHCRARARRRQHFATIGEGPAASSKQQAAGSVQHQCIICDDPPATAPWPARVVRAPWAAVGGRPATGVLSDRASKQKLRATA
jgi:hypothetical protein